MSHGLTHEELKSEIEKAENERNFPRLSELLGIPADVLAGHRVLSRKDRRKWYRENKARLGLPSWRLLETLKK